MSEPIATLDASAPEFDATLRELVALPHADNAAVAKATREIVQAVEREGDAALLEYTRQLDKVDAHGGADLEVSASELEAALARLESSVREALAQAAQRIREYHEAQLKAAASSWEYTDELGNTLGQRVAAMSRVGIYAPGGKAAYPSTVLMTAVPAKVAGVEELVLCSPSPNGEMSDVLLAAAHLAGVNRVFRIGGAQAIAALAYGTETVPRVDKIVGPGNVYVAAAKQMVFGQVGIDMIAGPSEVVIIADETADPEWIVQDLFAQAEHDELAQAILITDSSALVQAVRECLPARLNEAGRKNIIAASLSRRGAIILAPSLAEAVSISDRIAPEHLQLAVAAPDELLPLVRHAGAIFLGGQTAEVVGDYTAGPSHVLPTSGTARFASPLGVHDFMVRTSIIGCSREGAIELSRSAAILAQAEGLHAHAEAAAQRVKG